MNFAPGAWRYALVGFLAAPFALLFSVKASVVALLAGSATLAFFRDPDRTTPPTGLVSPADGTVSVLREQGNRVRLGIFMNVWHVHVVRTPVDAHVVDIEHVSGANRPAFSKASDRNERVHVRLEATDPITRASGDSSPDTPTVITDPPREPSESVVDDAEPADSRQFTVTLIAGAFARRIVPYLEPDDELDRGDRIGHIAFGSRVDVEFPPSVDIADIAVEPGDSMTAGETVILEIDDMSSDMLTAAEN